MGTRRELTRTEAFVSREAAEEAAEEGLVCAESDCVVAVPVQDEASSSTLQRTCIIHKYKKKTTHIRKTTRPQEHR